MVDWLKPNHRRGVTNPLRRRFIDAPFDAESNPIRPNEANRFFPAAPTLTVVIVLDPQITSSRKIGFVSQKHPFLPPPLLLVKEPARSRSPAKPSRTRRATDLLVAQPRNPSRPAALPVKAERSETRHSFAGGAKPRRPYHRSHTVSSTIIDFRYVFTWRRRQMPPTARHVP